MEKMRRKIIVTIKESWTKERSAWKKDDLKIEWWNVKCTQQSPSALEWNMDALVRRMHCKDANEETLPEHMWMNVCTRRDRRACYVQICDQIQINHWTIEQEKRKVNETRQCRRENHTNMQTLTITKTNRIILIRSTSGRSTASHFHFSFTQQVADKRRNWLLLKPVLKRIKK